MVDVGCTRSLPDWEINTRQQDEKVVIICLYASAATQQIITIEVPCTPSTSSLIHLHWIKFP